MATLLHLQRNTGLLLQLMQHLDCRISDEELRAIAAEKRSRATGKGDDPAATRKQTGSRRNLIPEPQRPLVVSY